MKEIKKYIKSQLDLIPDEDDILLTEIGMENAFLNVLNEIEKIENKQKELNISDFEVKILEEYALENLISVRDTTDLSPLEQWLIVEMYKMKKN